MSHRQPKPSKSAQHEAVGVIQDDINRKVAELLPEMNKIGNVGMQMNFLITLTGNWAFDAETTFPDEIKAEVLLAEINRLTLDMVKRARKARK